MAEHCTRPGRDVDSMRDAVFTYGHGAAFGGVCVCARARVCVRACVRARACDR